MGLKKLEIKTVRIETGIQAKKCTDQMKKLLKNVFRKIGIEVKRIRPNIEDDQAEIISIKHHTGSRENVLISYHNSPFLMAKGEPIPFSHSNLWESHQIANTFLNLGYNLDIIHYLNTAFLPEKNYEIFIDVRKNMERIGAMLGQNCIKIFHIDTAHWLFHNTALMNRLLSLKRRRGVSLNPVRAASPNWGIEHSDCATLLGNDFTVSTYSYAKKPIYRIPISCSRVFEWPERKDFVKVRKSFLWFNSHGFVHKGLDLVLEAFSELPEYSLTICGPMDGEKDFQKVYEKELYHTQNIHTVGWIDISSAKFLEIINNCVGVVMLSCSEGQSGSVVTCLHAGLIPIISYESGVDVKDFGIILNGCSIEEIKEAIKRIGELNSEELRHRSRRAWEFARENHTREKFAVEYRRAIEKIIDVHKKNKA